MRNNMCYLFADEGFGGVVFSGKINGRENLASF